MFLRRVAVLWRAHGPRDAPGPIRLGGACTAPRLTTRLLRAHAPHQLTRENVSAAAGNSSGGATFPCGRNFPQPEETPDGETCLYFDPHCTRYDMRERTSPT